MSYHDVCGEADVVKVSFQQWWRDYSRENERDVYAAATHLRSYVEDLPGDLRSEFIGELANVVCRRDGLSGAAAKVLESVADGPACASLYAYLQGLTRAGLQEQEQEATVLRILGRTNASLYGNAVNAFLFEKLVGMYFVEVVWTQWPGNPDVFGRAFMRYFAEISPDQVRGTAVIQALLSNPEALGAVRRACFAANRLPLWRRIADAARHTTLPGMTTQHQSAVTRILSDDRPPS